MNFWSNKKSVRNSITACYLVQQIPRFTVIIKILNLGCITILEKQLSNISKSPILSGGKSVTDGSKGCSTFVPFGNINYVSLHELKEEVSSVHVEEGQLLFFFFATSPFDTI